MSNVSDPTIFKRIQKGDEEAFSALFDTYYTLLCFFANKYLEDLDLSRSLVQQVFVDIWIKREKINVSHSVKSYLYNAVRNRCIDSLRKKIKTTEISDLVKQSNQTPFYNMVEEAELNERINSSINELPEKCRKIFVLCRLNGMKYSEISWQLGISVKTVEMQMGIALKRIRKNLSDSQMINLLVFIYSKKN